MHKMPFLSFATLDAYSKNIKVHSIAKKQIALRKSDNLLHLNSNARFHSYLFILRLIMNLNIDPINTLYWCTQRASAEEGLQKVKHTQKA